MKIVRIIKDWDWPDLRRQTSNNIGIWDNIKFLFEPSGKCDYAIILNRLHQDTTIQCPPEHIWAIIQEPPYQYYSYLHKGNSSYQRIYTTDSILKGKQYYHSQPALPWHINRDYDYLQNCDIPKKEKMLSWVTSSKSNLTGHLDRLNFLDKIKNEISFDLFGKGFNYIEDKWFGVAPYQYSIVIENYCNPFYWSEKISDCFLSWTIPLYYGCTHITDYFPSEALVQIDINDPNCINIIRETISKEPSEKQKNALHYARQLVLEKHQLFPFISDKIKEYEKYQVQNVNDYPCITIPKQERPLTYKEYLLSKFKKRTH